VFWRILFFYVLGSLAIGVIVPANDDRLLSGGAGAASSPWVIGIVRAGIPVLPHIINAVILTSAASSGNAFLYTGSRYLFALAQNGQAPKVLLTCTKAGVPVYCVLATASVGLLTYMTVSSGANNVFGWFQTVSCRLECRCFPCQCWLEHSSQPSLRSSPGSASSWHFWVSAKPFTAYAALVFFIIIVIFNGWKVFTHDAITGASNWSIQDFVTA
jgi:amino acid transporter